MTPPEPEPEFEDLSLEEALGSTKQKQKPKPQARGEADLPQPTRKKFTVKPGSIEVPGIGVILYPTDFCPGITCPEAEGQKHPFSYIRLPKPLFWWVHAHCHRPTLAWWDATFKDMVQINEDVKLPWD